jgi:hypothetical protein
VNTVLSYEVVSLESWSSAARNSRSGDAKVGVHALWAKINQKIAGM